MRRQTFFNDATLAEIAGRCRFGASDVEGRIEEWDVPEPKPWSYPTHKDDAIAAEFGLRGFEFKALQEAALKEMPHNDLLKEYYRKFLMVAKLVCDDAVEKVRKHERHVAEEKVKRESGYREKMRQYEARKKKLLESWTNVRSTIRTRWSRMEKSLAKLLEMDASLASMADRDYSFIQLLEKRGILEISENRVISVNWDRYQDMSIEDINEVILELNDSPGGNFIKQKDEVEEAF